MVMLDCVGKLKSIEKLNGSRVLSVTLPQKLMNYFAPKCSVSIDGISLTVNYVTKNIIKISIIPFTWENTNLQSCKVGDSFNVEIDMLARYVHKALKMKSSLTPIKQIIAELSKGKMVVVVDDENRENEGDLIFCAKHVDSEKINFMAKHARGLVCLV